MRQIINKTIVAMTALTRAHSVRSSHQELQHHADDAIV